MQLARVGGGGGSLRLKFGFASGCVCRTPLLPRFQFLFDVNESFRRANKAKSMEISKTNCNLLFIARLSLPALAIIDCLPCLPGFSCFPCLLPFPFTGQAIDLLIMALTMTAPSLVPAAVLLLQPYICVFWFRFIFNSLSIWRTKYSSGPGLVLVSWPRNQAA